MSSLLELLKAKKQDLAAGKRRKTAKPTEGTSRWRVLPSWRKTPGQPFWADFGQHFVKSLAGDLQAVYICTDKTFGKPCGICEAIKQGIKGSTDDATMKLLKDASASARVLVNAVKTNTITGVASEEVEILELPPTVFGAMVDVMEQWEAAGQSILDLLTGRDILITRTGAGLNTKYVVQVSAMATQAPANCMDKVHDLDAYVQQESSEMATRALNSVRSVAGLLQAPSLSGLPAAASVGAMSIADEYEVAEPRIVGAAANPVAAPVFEDVPWVESVAVAPQPLAAVAPQPLAAAVAPQPVAAVAPQPTPVAAPVVSSGDPELDALLNSLNT